MKNKSLCLYLAFVLIGIESICLASEKSTSSCFSGSLTTGYVFKQDDHTFKEVYGLGMVDVITLDGCYQGAQSWGIGAKVGYWVADGRTTFFNRHTFLQEVPITAYLKGSMNVSNCVQMYAALGGGAIWLKEKSYLGKSHTWKGIGEVEFGLKCAMWRCLNFTSAFRYLFPRQSHCHSKINVGGLDLRAGFGISF